MSIGYSGGRGPGPQRVRGPRRRCMTAAASVLTLAVTAACTSGASLANSRGSAGMRYDANSHAVLALSKDAPTFQLTVSPGDFSGAGQVKVGSSSTPPPTLPGFTAAAGPVDVHVTGPLKEPLLLSFGAGTSHPGQLPVLLHYSGSTWNIVAIGPDGGSVAAPRRVFSPYIAGWLSEQPLLDALDIPLVEKVGQWAKGRTSPPTCTSPPPKWAARNDASDDVLLYCLEGVPGHSEKARIKVKDNRGLAVQLALASELTDVDVEDQPSLVRALVRTMTETSNGIVLGSGGTMTVTVTQPDTHVRTVVLDPQLSGTALAIELITQVMDLPLRKAAATVQGFIQLVGCFGVKSEYLVGALPSSLDAAKSFILSVAKCAAKVATNPALLTQLSYFVTSKQTGRSVEDLQADPAVNAQVEEVGGKLAKGGVVMKALGEVAAAATLTKLGVNVYGAIKETLDRHSNPNGDPAVLTLPLSPKHPAPNPGALSALPQTDAGAAMLASFLARHPAFAAQLLINTVKDAPCNIVKVYGFNARYDHLDVAADLTGGCGGDPSEFSYQVRHGTVNGHSVTCSGCEGTQPPGLFDHNPTTPSTFTVLSAYVDGKTASDLVIVPGNTTVGTVLRHDHDPYAVGWGTAHPPEIFLGGDPTGLFDHLVWSNWGSSTATATGRGSYNSPNQTVADGHSSRVIVIADNLGNCRGQMVYAGVSWYFPDEGEHAPPPAHLSDPCGGA